MTNHRDLQADFDHAQNLIDEMTPLPTWWQRLGWLLCVLSAVLAVTGLYAIVVLPAMLLWELAVGR